MTDDERKAARAAKRKALRDSRRLAGRCVACDAGLSEDDLRLGDAYCVECTEKRAKSSRKFEERKPGRWRKPNRSATARAARNERRRKKSRANSAAGFCVIDCCKSHKYMTYQRCKRHVKLSAGYSATWHLKKKVR